jgi:hypothetical protein
MSGDLLYSNNALKFKGAPKVYKMRPHELHWPHSEFIIGFCGVAEEMIKLIDFYQQPEAYGKLPRTRDTKGVILIPDGSIYMFDSPATWMAVKEPHWAVGSGSLTALGAMHAGAGTRDAIKASMKVDPFTGGGVTTVKF